MMVIISIYTIQYWIQNKEKQTELLLIIYKHNNVHPFMM